MYKLADNEKDIYYGSKTNSKNWVRCTSYNNKVQEYNSIFDVYFTHYL